jgi:hypothetical protein
MSSFQLKIIIYAFLGGVTWTVHFLLIYAIAEFGCLAGARWIHGSIIFLTVPLVILTLFALRKSYMVWRREENALDQTSRYLGGYGVISNAVFAFIIIYQTIPVFYFKGECF